MVKKRIAIVVLGLMVLIALSIWGYNLVQAEHWRQQNHAVHIARQSAGLVHVDKLDWFNGDEPYTIIFGEDKDQRKIIVWVGRDDLHAAPADEGATKAEVEQKVRAMSPGAAIIHATPGKYQSQYVWEVYYKTGAKDKPGHAYAYFRFSDGALLDQLHMN